MGISGYPMDIRDWCAPEDVGFCRVQAGFRLKLQDDHLLASNGPKCRVRAFGGQVQGKKRAA